MYGVFIVDDEEPARETLKYLINWEQTPFRIMGSATNGKEAVEAYPQLKPKLIITDIQMPVMDGLELIRRVRMENRAQKFVILSCHENFNYAKEAIKLGVSDYLLKDLLTPQDLYSLLEKIKNEILDEERLKLDEGCLTGSPNLKEDFFKEEYKNIALQGIAFENYTNESLGVYIKEFKLDFSAKFYVVLCIVIDDYVKYIGNLDRIQEKHRKFEIIRIIKDILNEFNGGECFYDEKGTFVAVAGIGDVNSEYNLISTCYTIANKIHTNLARYKSVTVTIGVSSCFSSLMEIRKKYTEAMEVAKYRVFMGKGKTILYNVKFVKAASLNPGELDTMLNEIKTGMEAGNLGKVKSLLKNLYNDDVRGFVQYNYLKYINSQLFGIIAEYCSKTSVNYLKVFECEYLPVERLEEFETIQEMLGWFCGIMDRLFNSEPSSSALVYSKHVKDAIKYIKENYGCKLGLSQISEELGVNKAYLCRIFKLETGENITDFINKIRIEKAKQLMMATNCRMYEVAEKVGFTNMQHFNNSFKKITGQNPLKFRNNSI